MSSSSMFSNGNENIKSFKSAATNEEENPTTNESPSSAQLVIVGEHHVSTSLQWMGRSDPSPSSFSLSPVIHFKFSSSLFQRPWILLDTTQPTVNHCCLSAFWSCSTITTYSSETSSSISSGGTTTSSVAVNVFANTWSKFNGMMKSEEGEEHRCVAVKLPSRQRFLLSRLFIGGIGREISATTFAPNSSIGTARKKTGQKFELLPSCSHDNLVKRTDETFHTRWPHPDESEKRNILSVLLALKIR